MSDRGMRPGWIALGAGVLLLTGLVAYRIAHRRPDNDLVRAGDRQPRPNPGRAPDGSPKHVRSEPQRMADQALLLELLHLAQPEDTPEGPKQEKDLALEAAQYPNEYHSLLQKILQDPKVDERWKQAALLVADLAPNLRTAEAVHEFAKSSTELSLKSAAVAALGRLSAKLRNDQHLPVPLDYLTTLEKLRKHEAPEIRSASHTALWNATHQDFGDEQRTAFVRQVLEDADPFVFTRFYASLLGTNGLRGRTVEEELSRQFARFSDPVKRAAIVTALGNASAEGASPVLASAIADADPGVRRAAIHAIGRLKDSALLPTLKVMLEDEVQTDAATRQVLLKCIASFGTRESAQTLGRFALGGADRALRDEALAYLQSAKGVKGDDELARLLIERLDNPADLNRRESLVYALGCTDTAAAAETLRREYGKAQTPEMKETIVHAALGMKQDSAYALLATGLPQISSRSLRRGILSFLSEEKRPELLPVLQAEYAAPGSDGGYRMDLIEAALSLGTPAAAAFLREAAGREKDERVRKSLNKALQELKN